MNLPLGSVLACLLVVAALLTTLRMSLAHGIAHVRGATAIGRFAARSSALVSAAAPLVRIPGNTTRGATRVMATGSSASLTYGKPIVMPARQQHSATVIMLHGLGDTGDGWADIGPMFAADLPQVKFVFPTAPRVSHIWLAY